MTTITDPSVARARIHELRVKIKSLAAEARIIRHEERRAIDSARRTNKSKYPTEERHLRAAHESLHGHRVRNLRWEARAALIAYAIMRGMPRSRMEPGNTRLFDMDLASSVLSRFAGISSKLASSAVLEWAMQRAYSAPTIGSSPGSA